jgi:protein TonB
VDPEYPLLAKKAHITGDVVLSAVIGADGKIENLSAVSGHPMLVEAAMNAVRQWVYRPTILNGTAFQVVTEIVVHFRLMS